MLALCGMRVWNCGDVMNVVGEYTSCEVGSVFPIGEYENG